MREGGGEVRAGCARTAAAAAADGGETTHEEGVGTCGRGGRWTGYGLRLRPCSGTGSSRRSTGRSLLLPTGTSRRSSTSIRRMKQRRRNSLPEPMRRTRRIRVRILRHTQLSLRRRTAEDFGAGRGGQAGRWDPGRFGALGEGEGGWLGALGEESAGCWWLELGLGLGLWGELMGMGGGVRLELWRACGLASE